ncbi:MAG: hypothetical protein MK207_15725 [Saprospiraceae bacterium]|nr:hypothetical protein [Saprospiraceae bacterium]
MKYSVKFIISLIIITIYFLPSCTDKLPEPQEPPLDCSSNIITYDDHIFNILESNCNTSGCHDNLSVASFGAYATLSTSRKETIASRVADGSMPPSGNISTANADSIRCWQENGFLEK